MAKIATLAQKKTSARGGFSASENVEIEKLAYQFFVDRGYHHGSDREDWLKAEAIIRSKRS